MRGNIIRRGTAVLLVLCMLLGLMQTMIFASGTETKGNYVFNHGDTSNVTNYGGKGHTISSALNATRFGEAISIAANTTKGKGWVRVPATVPSDFDFQATAGIACYVKFPTGVSATNVSIRLINKTWTKYFEVGTDIELTLVDTDGKRSTVKQAIAFENMQGFEGYVFIPYEALSSKKPASVSSKDLNSTAWNIEISTYTENSDRVNVPFCFDEIGYYADIDEYIALSESSLNDVNYVFNSGVADGVKIVNGDGHNAVVTKDVSVFGDALNIYPTATKATGWAQIEAKVKESGFDFASTQGIAMYVKLPAGGKNTNINLRLIKKDWSGEYYQIGLNKLLTFITLDGVNQTVTTKTQYLPLEDLQGFEGFVFIPYEALTDGNAATVNKSLLNSSDWAVEISLYYDDPSCIGLSYYFDEIGFYNDAKGYVNEILGKIIDKNEIVNNGDASKIKADGITAQLAETATQYGNGIALSGNGSATLPVEVSDLLDVSLTEGIAVYAKLPAAFGEGAGIGITDGSKDYLVGKDNKVILIAADGSYKTAKWNNESVAGYEGFIFIPYSSLGGNVKAQDLKSGSWSFKFSNIGQANVVVDEIGFYANPRTYAKLAVKQPSVNHIFNDGDASVIKVYSGRDVTISQVDNASWCGDAVNLAPSKTYGGGWAQIPATTPKGYDYSATKGIAMYVKMPLMMTDSSLGIRLINKGWTKWYTLDYQCEVTLIHNDGTEENVSGNISSLIAGYEGFLFIPYTSMTEGSETVVDKTVLNATDWNVEIGYYAKSETNIGPEYIFDEVGYYSDMRGYINTVKQKYSNDVSNDGTNNSALTVKDGSGISHSETEALYGKAYDIAPTATGKSGYVNIPMSARDGFSFIYTTGIAMYVKLPEELGASGIDVRLIKNDRSEFYSMGSGQLMTLVKADGETIQTSEDITKALAGYEGFVFIPYSSLCGNAGKVVDPAVLNNTDWGIEVGYNAADGTALSKSYVFDELGYYCNIEEYIALARGDFGGENYIFNIGDATNVTVYSGEDIKAETKHRSAAYGDVILFAPTKLQGSGWMQIPAFGDQGFNYNLTRGIAMYVEMPESVVESGLTVRLINKDWTEWYTLSDNNLIYLADSDGNITKITSGVRNALAGYEGFVFIPYTSMTEGSTSKVNTALLNSTDWNIEVGFYASSQEAVSAEYRIDEIGYYSDMEKYLELAAEDLGKSAVEDPDGPADPIAEMEKGNYIANHGNSLNEVWQHGSMILQEDSIVSPYGKSVVMYPTETTPSQNTFGAYYINMPEGKVLENAKGIAFYMHFPEGGTQTQVQLLLQVDNQVYWVCEDNTDAIIYDMEGNRMEQTMWYPLADMQGFEGYVFVPFTSMHYGGAGGKTGVDVNLLAGKTVSFRFGHYRWNENELNLKYVVDEIGYYGDEKGYLSLLKAQKGKAEVQDSGNYLMNNCDQQNKVTVRNAAQISVIEKEGVGDTRYAIALRANNLKANQPYAYFKADITNQDFSKSKGVAMYVNFPEDVTRTNSTVMISVNESLYYSVVDNPKYTLIDMSGKKKEVNPAFALGDLAGFEGYVFIPFDQFVSKTGVALDGNLLNGMRFDIKISQYRDNRTDINKEYIYDSIGFYADMEDYITLVKSTDDPERPNTGDFIYKTYDNLDGDYNIYTEIKFEKVDDVTGMGSAVAVTPTATNLDHYVWFVSPFSKDEDDWNTSTGLAFYIEIPEGVRDSSSEIFLVNTDTDFWRVKSGANITLLSIYGEISTVSSNGLPLKNLSGYKGFVFVPFDQFSNGMGYPGKLEELIDTYSKLQFRIGLHRTYESDINVPYIYDSVGYYRTIDSYLKLLNYEFKEKPADLNYYNTSTDADGFFMVNNVKDSGAYISGTYGITSTPSPDAVGSEFAVDGDFSINLNNFRRGDELLFGTQGISMYVRNIKDLSDLVFKVGIVDDSNSSAIEQYEFDSTVSEFYYSVDGRLYVMTAADLKLFDNFEGYIYLPFDNFAPNADSVPDNLVVDPDAITSISISSSGAAEFCIADVSFYSTQNMLETSVGMPKSPFDFTIIVSGDRAGAIAIAGNQIRLYDSFTYAELKKMLKVSNPDFDICFTDNSGNVIESEGGASGDFKLQVVCGKSFIGELSVIRVTDIFVNPERVEVKPEVKPVAGSTVTRNEVYTTEFDASAEDFVTDDFFTVKKSASAVIKFVEGELSVSQVVTVSRLLSAFNLFNDVKMRVLSPAGKAMGDNDVVTNDCRLIVSLGELNILLYKIKDVPLDSKKDNTPSATPEPVEEAGNVWIIVIIALAAVVAAGAVVTVIIVLKRRKKNK